MPWLFGSDWVGDRATNGWDGCIGETRVVDRPLPPEQWLTARADLSGLAVTSPTDGAASRRRVTAKTGTGLPGATVTVAGDARGSAVVRADRTWTADLGRGRPRIGDYEVVVHQSLGIRASDPVTVTYRFGRPTRTVGEGRSGASRSEDG